MMSDSRAARFDVSGIEFPVCTVGGGGRKAFSWSAHHVMTRCRPAVVGCPPVKGANVPVQLGAKVRSDGATTGICMEGRAPTDSFAGLQLGGAAPGRLGCKASSAGVLRPGEQ